MHKKIEKNDFQLKVTDKINFARHWRKKIVPFLIGKEFEALIDSHGPDHVTGLMQKVIHALEHLEQLTSEKEIENQHVENLKSTITRLVYLKNNQALITQYSTKKGLFQARI